MIHITYNYVMNLNHLRLFDAVASEGNISRAAEVLMVSQPAVSKQLRELEKSIGVPLFERLPKGVRLTDAGKILQSHARAVFIHCDQALAEIGELRGLQRGELVVAASMNVGVHLLPDVFVAFRRRYPQVQLRLEMGDSEMICRKLQEGAVQVGFTEGVVEQGDIESAVQARDELIAIASPGHPLARKRSITAAMLCREPFIVRETGSGTKSMVERALAKRGLAVNPVMSLGSTEAIKRAVAGGVGMAIVSSLSVAMELKARQLVQLRLSDLKMDRPIFRLTRRGGVPSAALREFLKML